ncbi:MAG: MFS transporter [Pseudomonadota bacterium]
MNADTPLTRSLLIILAMANFVVGMGAFVVIGVIEPVAQDLGVAPATAGQLLTVYALAYAPLSPLLVALTGRIGRRRVLTAGLTLFALAAMLGALAPSYDWLAASRILAAAGAGVVTPVGAAIVAGLAPPDRRASALAAVFLGITLAQVLGVPAGSWVAYTFGWRAALWIVVALAVPTALLIWTRVPAGLQFQATTLKDLGALLRDGPMMLAIAITAVFLGAIFTLYTYMAPLLSGTMGYGRDQITLILLVFGVGAVIGNILGGWLADRYGAGRTLLGLFLVQLVAMPFYSLLPVATPLLVLWTLGWSTLGWAFGNPQQLRLVILAGPRAPVALALNASAIYVGSALGSGFGALLISGPGYSALGLGAAVAMLAAIAALLLSLRVSGRTA